MLSKPSGAVKRLFYQRQPRQNVQPKGGLTDEVVGVQVAETVLVVLQRHLEVDAVRRVGAASHDHGPAAGGHVAVDVDFAVGVVGGIDFVDAVLAVSVAEVVAAVKIG